MPDDRTAVTELATALGMTGHLALEEAVAARPPALDIRCDAWGRLERALATGDHSRLARTAFENGRFFGGHAEGLDGRPPRRIEWSGGRRIPGDQPIPADLLVDSVYMVSCKYLSRILHNTSPSRIFDEALATASSSRPLDWYQAVAPEAHGLLYRRTVEVLGLDSMPDTPADAGTRHRARLRQAVREHQRRHGSRGLPDGARAEYKTLIDTVSRESAHRWRAAIKRLSHPQLMLWRLLRIYSAAYFILGVDARRTMRLRVMTPWEWRQAYELLSFEVSSTGRGQPRVDWNARYAHWASGSRHQARGHIELRWSHGPFSGMPEAKAYLDMPHQQVPGYQPLNGPDEPLPSAEREQRLPYA